MIQGLATCNVAVRRTPRPESAGNLLQPSFPGKGVRDDSRNPDTGIRAATSRMRPELQGMKFVPTRIAEVVVIEPEVLRDSRGFFLESYNARKYREGGIEATFVQDNHSSSVSRTLRGLHAQKRFPQDKLIRCVEGEVFDVVVDVRRGSPTFGQWVGVTLTAENFKQVYVPRGFAHGFCVLSESAQVEYKVTEFYHPEDEIGILWNDPQISIDWPIKDPLLSEKDATNRTLAEVLELLPAFRGSGS